MMTPSETGLGLVSRPERTIYAVSKDANWLAKLQQAARAEHVTLKAASSITSLVNQMGDAPGVNAEIECILIDHEPALQRWSGIEKLLFEKNIAAPVILVLDNADNMADADAIAQVAHVVATRKMEVPEIIEAIQDARGLRTWVRHQFDVLRCHRMYEQLLQRQRKIVDLVVDGAPNKKIATALNVSVKTIERERQRAYQQLSVRSTAEMTRVVILASLHDVVFASQTARPRGTAKSDAKTGATTSAVEVTSSVDGAIVDTQTRSREPRIDSTATSGGHAPTNRPFMVSTPPSSRSDSQHFA
ncbi:MAG: LuxR C-terminal-related transcriptional regulator [Planctomycetota bacterium]